jgi:hypothetical protein
LNSESGIILSREHSQWKRSSTLKGEFGPLGWWFALAITCGFRFEVRPEDEVVELQADHRTVHVCVDCLTLLTVHRRIHHMKVEKVIVEMAERRPVLAEA